MARSQSRVNRQLNEEKVLDDIKKALRSHEMQQDSALEATAYCYAAWTDTQFQYASGLRLTDESIFGVPCAAEPCDSVSCAQGSNSTYRRLTGFGLNG